MYSPQKGRDRGIGSQVANVDSNAAAIRLSNVGNFSFGGAVLKNPSSPQKGIYNEKVHIPGRNFAREVTPHITD
jgi:hypothetical protein